MDNRSRGRLRRFSAALNMGLVVLVVIVFATGYIASWLALTEFAPHRYSSFALIAGVCAHLALHWRSLVAQVQRFRIPARVPVRTDVTAAGVGWASGDGPRS
jgi:hypothetical protein